MSRAITIVSFKLQDMGEEGEGMMTKWRLQELVVAVRAGNEPMCSFAEPGEG